MCAPTQKIFVWQFGKTRRKIAASTLNFGRKKANKLAVESKKLADLAEEDLTRALTDENILRVRIKALQKAFNPSLTKDLSSGVRSKLRNSAQDKYRRSGILLMKSGIVRRRYEKITGKITGKK